MNVLFYTYGLNMGGAERSVAGLANKMCEAHKVTIAQYIADKPFYEVDERIVHIPLSIDVKKEGKVTRSLKLIKTIRRIIIDESIDVIFCFDKSHLPLLKLAKQGTSAALIGTERTIPYQKLKPNRSEKKAMQKFRVCDGVVFQTKRVQQMYPKCIQSKSTVIPNALFNQDVLSKIYNPIRKKQIVATGRLVPLKGFDTLICAFAKSNLWSDGYQLLIFGKGPDENRLLKIINDCNMQLFVHLMGEDPKACDSVAESQIFVLSSRFEGMPNALIEAMGCGVACVSTDCACGPAELIENNVNGILVPVDDLDKLSDSLIDLSHNEEKREFLAKKAYDIREIHSIKNISEKWISFAEEYMPLH